MKLIIPTILIALLLIFHNGNAQERYFEQASDPGFASRAIIVSVEIPLTLNQQLIEVSYNSALSIMRSLEQSKVLSQYSKDQFLKWIISSETPITLKGKFLLSSQMIMPYVVEPEDSIHINWKNDIPIFTGRGAEKVKLVYELHSLNKKLMQSPEYKSMSGATGKLRSLEDYLTWHHFLNEKRSTMMSLLDSYKPRISSYAYNFIKVCLFEEIERRRHFKFEYLRSKPDVQGGEISLRVNKFGLTEKDLNRIYDSTMINSSSQWLQRDAPSVFLPAYLFGVTYTDFCRKKGFFKKLKGPAAYAAIYDWAKKKYKGLIREEVLKAVFTFPIGAFRKLGFHPVVDSLLTDYYSQPGFSEYKQIVKNDEFNRRNLLRKKGAVNFTLVDDKGNEFTNKGLEGKVALLDFWFTGCTGCLQMTPALKIVEQNFKNDSNVIFISISIDKDKNKWLRSLSQKKFTTGEGINLFTGGLGFGHEIISKFSISGYPTLMLVDHDGRLVPYSDIPDPRKDDGKGLIELIKSKLAYLKDGPYVFFENKKATSYTIYGKAVEKKFFTEGNTPILSVATDQSSDYQIVLQRQLEAQPSEYDKPGKLFALSDIEGNFDAFRELLQNNRVIDKDLNWTFGNGHLVFAGDMFDRGDQVTECLWLIYSLEDQARNAGGYVHFILGNHEIMNLQHNHKYVESKYKKNAELMGKSLSDLYTTNTELGRWLRTKNIIEKIGDILFVHGGLGKEFSDSISLSIREINDLARVYLDDSTARRNPDPQLQLIFNQPYSPFWYRSFYEGTEGKTKMASYITPDYKRLQKPLLRPNVNQLDSILSRWQVKRIVTGHTIVSNSISVHYGGKVINTDTDHAEGKSEALLVEGDSYFKVNTSGERILLFIDNKSNNNQ